MGALEAEVQQLPLDPTKTIETAREAHATLADANTLLATLKAKLAEVEAAGTGVADLTAAAKAKLAEVEAASVGMVDVITAANAKLTEINEAASSALGVRSAITDTQAVIATKSAHIQDAQAHADKVRAELDRNLTAATQKTTETEGLRARAQAAADGVAPIIAAITTTKASTQADLTATNAARDEAKASSAATKALADKAVAIETSIAGYEAALAELQKQGKEKLETINSLLPAATSAGLAHAFDARRQTFLRPVKLWEGVFVASVVALAVLAGTSLVSVYMTHAVPPWDEVWRMWAIRLPFAGALIWLAMHAASKSALAQRLEEDYGFKAATAAQFQGFQEQMTKVGALPPDSPLAKLYADTLAIIANPPGRIYDKHQLIVKPTAEIAAAATTGAAVVKEVLSPRKAV
jgi:hypothetical protein